MRQQQTDFSPAYFPAGQQSYLYHQHQPVVYSHAQTSSYNPYNSPYSTINQTSLTSLESSTTTTTTGTITGEDDSIWRQVERRMYTALEASEQSRRMCAYCGIREDDDERRDDNDEPSTKPLLGRCYGCQLTYYCSQEHQHLDWIQSHMPRCAELEWVGLCELVQATQIALPLPGVGEFWPPHSNVATWTDWFELRADLVKCAHLVAKTMEQNLWSRANSATAAATAVKLNRREPTASEIVDGLLAQVTDSITYALTLGDAIRRFGIDPSEKPTIIHILSPHADLFDDLVGLFMEAIEADNDLESAALSSLDPCSEIKLDQADIDLAMKRKFLELTNMFPNNRGFELVFIAADTVLDTSRLACVTHKLRPYQKQMLIDWSRLLKPPNAQKQTLNNSPPNTSIHVSAWQGTYSNFMRYCVGNIGVADLVVSFHPDFTVQPSKLTDSNTTTTKSPKTPLASWSDDLRTILVQQRQVPCLFTFATSEEKQRAAQALTTSFQANFVGIKPNEFSSLLLRSTPSKPNQVFSTNGFSMFLKGSNSSLLPTTQNITTSQAVDPISRFFKVNSNNCATDYLLGNGVNTPTSSNNNSIASGADTSSLLLKKSKSIQNILQLSLGNQQQQQSVSSNYYNSQYQHNQNDACIQTMGLDEPTNPSLRHVNGKIQISKQNLQNTTHPNPHQRLNSQLAPINTPMLYKSTENLSLHHHRPVYNQLVDIYLDHNHPPSELDSTLSFTNTFANQQQQHNYQINSYLKGNFASAAARMSTTSASYHHHHQQQHMMAAASNIMPPGPPPLQTPFQSSSTSNKMTHKMSPPILDYQSFDHANPGCNQPYRPHNFVRYQPNLAVFTRIESESNGAASGGIDSMTSPSSNSATTPTKSSNKFKISPKPDTSRYYQPKILTKPSPNYEMRNNENETVKHEIEDEDNEEEECDDREYEADDDGVQADEIEIRQSTKPASVVPRIGHPQQQNTSTTPLVQTRTRSTPRAPAPRTSSSSTSSSSSRAIDSSSPQQHQQQQLQKSPPQPTKERQPYTKPRHSSTTNTASIYMSHEQAAEEIDEDIDNVDVEETTTVNPPPNAKPRSTETRIKPRRSKQQRNPLPKPRNSIRGVDEDDDELNEDDSSEVDHSSAATTTTTTTTENYSSSNQNESSTHSTSSSTKRAHRRYHHHYHRQSQQPQIEPQQQKQVTERDVRKTIEQHANSSSTHNHHLLNLSPNKSNNQTLLHQTSNLSQLSSSTTSSSVSHSHTSSSISSTASSSKSPSYTANPQKDDDDEVENHQHLNDLNIIASTSTSTNSSNSPVNNCATTNKNEKVLNDESSPNSSIGLVNQMKSLFETSNNSPGKTTTTNFEKLDSIRGVVNVVNDVEVEEPEYVNVTKYFTLPKAASSKATKLPPPPQYAPPPPLPPTVEPITTTIIHSTTNIISSTPSGSLSSTPPPLPTSSPPRSKSVSPINHLAPSQPPPLSCSTPFNGSSPFKQLTTTENLVTKIISSDMTKREENIGNLVELVSHRSETHREEVVMSRMEPNSRLAESSLNPATNYPNYIHQQHQTTTLNKTSTNYTLQTVKLAPSCSSTASSSRNNNQYYHHQANHHQQQQQSQPGSHFRFLSSHSNGGGAANSERSTTRSQSSLNNTINGSGQRVFIRNMPDAVDEIKLQYEGERHVVLPGYMTSVDILRNMLLNNTTDMKAVVAASVRGQWNGAAGSQMSLKEKLMMQKQMQGGNMASAQPAVNWSAENERNNFYPSTNNGMDQRSMNGRSIDFNTQSTRIAPPTKLQIPPPPQQQQHQQAPIKTPTIEPIKTPTVETNNVKKITEDDDEDNLSRKFNARNRTRSNSGVVTIDLSKMQTTHIIDIDLDDYESQNTKQPVVQNAPPTPPPSPPPPPPPPPTHHQHIHANREEFDHLNDEPIPFLEKYTSPPKNNVSLRGQIKPINPQTGRPTPTQILKSKPPTPLSVPPPSKPPPPPPKSPQHSPSVQSSPQQQQIENHYAVSHLIQQQHQQQYEQKPETTSTPSSTPKRNGAEIIRFNSFLSSQQQQQNQTPSQKHCVTGSFDPDDFDSFDEDDEVARASYHQRMQNSSAANGGNSNKQMFHIPLESIEKIRQSAFQPQQQQQIDLEPQSLPQPQLQQTNGHMQLVQFDPNDFDSFDEDEQENSSSNQLKASIRHSPPVQLPSINIDLSTTNKQQQEILDDEFKRVDFANKREKLEAMFNKSSATAVKTRQQQVESSPPEKQSQPAINHRNTQQPQQEIVHHVSPKVLSPEKLERLMESKAKSAQQQQQQTEKNSNFLRSALDRISNRSSKSKSKSRSSSVPMRTLINAELAAVPVEQPPPPPPPPQEEFYPQEIDDLRRGKVTMNSDRGRSRKQQQPVSESNHTSTPTTPTSTPKNLGNLTGKLANMKTLQLMSKMQAEHEEKAKKRKLRRQQIMESANLAAQSNGDLKQHSNNQSQQSIAPITPRSERKFLSSIMNTLFSGGGKEAVLNSPTSPSNSHEDEHQSNLVKNEAKRLSLKRLKAKDKAKKKGGDMTDYETREMNCQSDSEVNMQSSTSRKSSSYSLNIEETTLNSSKYRTIETAVSSTNIATTSSASASASAAAAALRYGKIKQESAQDNIQPTNGNKENLMRQLKAELDEEIKDRRMIEYKQNVINGTNGVSSPPSRASNGAPVKMREKSVDEGLSAQSNQNNNSNRKIRSKSVTFLDEMNTDDDELIEAMEVEQKAVLRQQFEMNANNQEYYIESAEGTAMMQQIGDARLMCAGGMNGAIGPIRGIMKKSTSVDTPEELPTIQLVADAAYDLNGFYQQQDFIYSQQQQQKITKSQTTPNFARKKETNHVLRSDL